MRSSAPKSIRVGSLRRGGNAWNPNRLRLCASAFATVSVRREPQAGSESKSHHRTEAVRRREPYKINAGMDDSKLDESTGLPLPF